MAGVGWEGSGGASEKHPSPFPALGLLHPRLQLRSPCWSQSWSQDCLALECSPAMAQDGRWLGPSVPDDLVQGPPHLFSPVRWAGLRASSELEEAR